jgi:hypothetical protein
MSKSKLQNVKAVKELLAGTHKTQTNKTFGFIGKSNKKREIGDVWLETTANGISIEWEQKDGFRVKRAANSVLDEINKIINMPATCPKCNSQMHNNEERLNKKFWKTHKTCFDCVITMETRLRAEGKYEEYARKKMFENAKSFFATADIEVSIIKDAIKNKLEFVQNAQGELEEFDQSNYKEKYLNYIDEQYNRFKEETLFELKKEII